MTFKKIYNIFTKKKIKGNAKLVENRNKTSLGT